MRANDFIYNEAALSTASSKSIIPYLKAILSAPSISIGPNGEKAQGLKLTPDSRKRIEQMITDYSSPGVDISWFKHHIMNTDLTFIPRSTYRLGQIFKSPELKSFSDKPSDSEDGTAALKKYWNDGEVAETFLGAALFAKFTSTGPVNEQSIIDVLSSSTREPWGFSGQGKRGTDIIYFSAKNKLQNNQVVEAYITDKETLAGQFPAGVVGLNKIIKASAAYVNESTKVLEAIREADANPESESIEIKTDGVSDQKGTKADLTLKIGKKERLLSLKANAVKQFGQDTGATPEVITTFFQRFIPDIDIDPSKDKEILAAWPEVSRKTTVAMKKAGGDLQAQAQQIYTLIGKVYRTANGRLQQKLASPETAASVVDDLYRGIIHHAQGGSTGQTLVILNPGEGALWKELEFGPQLLEALRSFRLESSVGVAGVDGESNHVIRIYGRAADSKAAVAMTTNIDTPQQAAQAAVAAKKKRQAVDSELLFQLRSYIQEAGPTIRNIVEMGPLLKSLTEVQKINQAPGAPEEPKPAATQPAAPADDLERIKNLAGVKPGPNTTTLSGTKFTSPAVKNSMATLKTSKTPMGQQSTVEAKKSH